MCSQAETTVYSRQREAQTGLHISTASPPHADTAPLGFPAPPPPRGPGPRDPRTEGGRAPVGGHMPLPAREGTTLPRLRRNAGKGGRALTLAHTHTPDRASDRHPPSLPPPASRRAPNAQAERPRAASGPAAHGAQLSPDRRGRPLPPRGPRAPQAPSLASRFPPAP